LTIDESVQHPNAWRFIEKEDAQDQVKREAALFRESAVGGGSLDVA